MGRPTKYRKKFCAELIQHMSDGYSFESFASKIDVNQDSLYEWAKKHTEFSEAKKIGYDKSRLFWEEIAIKACTGQIKINAAIWIFTMKNRFGWRDRDFAETIGTFEPLVIDLPNSKRQIQIGNKNEK